MSDTLWSTSGSTTGYKGLDVLVTGSLDNPFYFIFVLYQNTGLALLGTEKVTCIVFVTFYKSKENIRQYFDFVSSVLFVIIIIYSTKSVFINGVIKNDK